MTVQLINNTKNRYVIFLYRLTSRLINMHEDHFIIGSQNGVKLLVTNRGQLGHVPCVTLVHRYMDYP